MYNRSKILALAVIVMIPLSVILATIQPTTAKFTLSSWSFPDEYGQGIEGFEIYGNSTGAWVQVDGYYTAEDTTIFDWEVGVSIKLICYTWFDSELTGADNENAGKLLQKHNVTVRDLYNNIIFSQQNFTFVMSDDSINPPLWFYGYEVVLNFLPDYGQYYTVSVIYEIFW